MKIIKNHHKCPSLTGKYILEGYSPVCKHPIYGPLDLKAVIDYYLMKFHFLKSTYF